MTERIQTTEPVELPERELLQRRPADAIRSTPPGQIQRRETLTYADAIYTNGDAESPLAWLNQHSPLVTRAIAKVPYAPITAYDLGSGTGRHAITMAQRLHPESRVIAVDHSPTAVMQLRVRAHRLGLTDRVHAITADIAHYHLPLEQADLIVAAAALHPIASAQALQGFLQRCHDATRPGGINCFIIGCNRTHISAAGNHRPNAAGPGPDIDEARAILASVFADWERLEASETRYHMPDHHDDGSSTLKLNVIRTTVRRPL